MVIANFEGIAEGYYICINKHGNINAIFVKSSGKYYKWVVKAHASEGGSLKQLTNDHDEFEGLAEILGIDPENTLAV